MKGKTNAIVLLALFSAGLTGAATKDMAKKNYTAPIPTVSTDEEKEFKWGGDIRIREVYFDNIPYSTGGQARGGANHFQRYRTRVFGEYHPRDDLYVRGRLVNEFRTRQAPNGSKNTWAPFDETFFDNLYVDYKHELFDLRIGRQDLIYGTGKIILDGTPKDGSRSIYFDAVKATYKGIENTSVDLLAMYTYAKDRLAIHTQDRDIVGLGPGNGFDGAEAGGGIYIKNNGIEDLPWEAYYIAKTKEQGRTEQLNTVGTRLMPKFSKAVDANLEMAYQSDPDVSEFMIDALLSWHIKALEEQKACFGVGWYHLSEDWNPIFARWPQYSELYVYAYDTTGGGQWKNVSMPHIDFSISPCRSLKSDLLLGYMFAPEDNGTGGGHNRGLLFTWWNRFTLKENLFSEGDKLSGHLLLELMDAGNYYQQAERENTAVFARAELSYAF